jgi:hypothetical protein
MGSSRDMASRNYSSVPGELGRVWIGLSYAVEPGVEELDGLLGAGVEAGALAALSPAAEGALVPAGAAGFPDSEAASEVGAELFAA